MCWRGNIVSHERMRTVASRLLGPHGGKRRRMLKRLLIAGGITAALCISILGFFAYKFRELYVVQTSADASPNEVKFLQLPSTASHIGFYQNGEYEFAEFKITERELLRIFPKFKFREIQEPVTLMPNKFGDPKMMPGFYEPISSSVSQSLTITNGLKYVERFPNNGGYTVYYDRSKSRAFYDFSWH
jgi:hypothetical protein